MDPTLDLLDYLSSGINKFADQRKNELQLWHEWKESGHDPEKFRPLLTSFRPLLNKTTRQYSRSSAVPTEAVEAEVHTNFLNACKTYKPDAGTQLSSWVHTHLHKTQRYVNEYQNIGKIPEPRIHLINRFNSARDELHETHDRPPTHAEIVKHMNSMHPDKKPVSIKEIKNLEVELSRKDLSESGFDEGPAIFESPKELEAIRMLKWSNKLTDEERTVFNHVFGVHHDENGEHHIFHPEHMKKPGEIAKITGFSNSKISRIRNNIADKVRSTVDLL